MRRRLPPGSRPCRGASPRTPARPAAASGAPGEQISTPLLRCHPDRLTIKSTNNNYFIFKNAQWAFQVGRLLAVCLCVSELQQGVREGARQPLVQGLRPRARVVVVEEVEGGALLGCRCCPYTGVCVYIYI